MNRKITFLLFLLIVEYGSAQDPKYLTSTYANPKLIANVENQRETLASLEQKKVFSIIHNKQILALSEKHTKYFNAHSDYELLYSVKGDVFLNQKEDAVFILYDRLNLKVTFLLYNDLGNTYKELYSDIKVEDGLKEANCNYFNFGTLDYQMADNLVLFENSLIQNPNSFFEYNLCKVCKINKEEKLILKMGCISKKYNNPHYLNSNALCFASSLVYNNWDCMMYDSSRKVFVVFYGQAFAD